MLLRKIFYLRIEYHWYCIKQLSSQLSFSDNTGYEKLAGKIAYHKYKASELSFQYEVLAGIRNEYGAFIK